MPSIDAVYDIGAPAQRIDTVYAQYFVGNGAGLTNVTTAGSSINSGTSNVRIVSSGGNATVSIGGTSNVAVFSTGGVNVAANVTAGNLKTSGVNGNITGANYVLANYFAGISTSVSGNITGGNVLGGANVNATTHTGTTVSVTGIVTAASVVGGVMSGSSLTVATGTVTLGNIVNANGNGVGNIGSSTGYFNTVFAQSTTAIYADLAEYYSADAEYDPGTVLSFGGNNEVTMTTAINDVKVAGVVSTNPAHAMNAGIEAKHSVALALVGRVPTLVVGPVVKGDMMVSAGGGRAKACATPVMGSVIGKAVENHPGGQGVIEVVVGKL
jgi:hypothetical protein